MFGFGEDWPVWESSGFRARVPSMLKAFAKEERIGKILFINNPAGVSRFLKNILLKRRWGSKSGKTIKLSAFSYLSRVEDKIYTLDWVSSEMFDKKDSWMGITQGYNEKKIIKLINKAKLVLGIQNITLWTANPFVENIQGSIQEEFFAFDAIDNWLMHPYLKRYSNKIEKAYKQVSKKADLITTVSGRLKDFFCGLNAKNVLFLPNAVNYALYAKDKSDKQDIPSDLKNISHPILGFIGILSNDIDFNLLKSIAVSRPDWNIVLIGSKISGTDTSEIKGLKNIFFLGYKAPEVVKDYLASFDVCLSFYKTNSSSDSKDPMKLYEYLASGKPVISTDIREARKLEGFIHIASSNEEFIYKISDSFFKDTLHDKERRIALAKENSWPQRAKAVLDLEDAEIQKLKDLSIIIVNWNTKELLRECLKSIYQHIKGIDFEVIVVDNFSCDQSAHMVKEAFPQVKLIENLQNLGFGRANNQGFRESSGRHILFLNSDAKLITESMNELIDFSKNNPHIGIIGPKTLNPDGTTQISCQGFPRLWWVILSNLGLVRLLPKALKLKYNCYFSDFESSGFVDSVGGACLLMKRNIFSHLGGFDEDFFMYGEDLDLGFRCLKKGLKSYFLNIPLIMHYQNKSGIKRWDDLSRLKENYKSLNLFYRKHYNKLFSLIFHAVIFFGSLVRMIFYALVYFISKKSLYNRMMRLNLHIVLANLKH